MKREIKFKAEYKGKIYEIENIYFQDELITLIVGQFQKGNVLKVRIAEVNLIQYTGLKDKNKVEIYEKDITEEGSYTDWCKECIGYQQFGMADEGAFCHNCDGNYSLSDLVSDLPSELEVIGNIYSNPELLTK